MNRPIPNAPHRAARIAQRAARSLAAAAALALVVAPACKKRVEEHPAPKIEGKLMTGAEIRSALAGNTAQGAWTDGNVAFVGVLAADGTATTKFGKTLDEARAATGQSVAQSTWRVTDDGLLCMRTVKVGSDAVNAPESCQRVSRDGTRLNWYDADWKLTGRGTVEPGKAPGF